MVTNVIEITFLRFQDLVIKIHDFIALMRVRDMSVLKYSHILTYCFI